MNNEYNYYVLWSGETAVLESTKTGRRIANMQHSLLLVVMLMRKWDYAVLLDGRIQHASDGS